VKKKTINQLAVVSDPRWLTADNYAPSMEKRVSSVLYRPGVELTIKTRPYPIQKSFRDAGEQSCLLAHQWIDNTTLPPQSVLDAQLEALEELSEDCNVVIWDHAQNCYPEVAKHLPRLFDLAILPFADDCPGSTEAKTLPVARFFDALFYQMYIWDFRSGVRTESKYRDYAPDLKFYFKCQNESAGLNEGLADILFGVQNKIDALKMGIFPPIDFVFVGCLGWMDRKGFCSDLNAADFGGLHSRIHGQGMRDGYLAESPGKPVAYPVAKLYSQSLFGVNPQVSSIFNARLIDLWVSGVIQFIHDPHGELASQGFEAGVHYVSFDGTVADMIGKMHALRADPKAAANIMEQAHRKMVEYQTKRSTNEVYTNIYMDHLEQIENGR
jgi:hypothetical protein